jgi:AcrR family transcriptional regulator
LTLRNKSIAVTLHREMTDGERKKRGRPPSGGKEAILTSTLELLRERGIARLTTREVAARAGVSEASVFYHYGDRVGLLMAVFAHGLEPLQEANRGGISGPDHTATLLGFSKGIEGFLDQALPVFTAAQSDAELRDALARHMEEHDLGPHRGVEALATYLAAEQEAGRVRRDVDPRAVAANLVGSSFMRVYQRQMLGHGKGLPSARQSVETLATMLEPTP